MKHLNKKGFAISTMLYAMVMLVSLILFLLIGLQSFEYRSTSEFSDSIADELNDLVDSSVANHTPTGEFDYTGGIQTYTASVTGLYKLEVWGAEGGSSGSCSGGKGGYSTVTVPLNKNEVLFIGVGGAGSGTNTHTNQTGGYNGGGSATADSDANTRQASGGGATHIAKQDGSLASLGSSQNSILVVAGGGGGAGNNAAVMCTSGGAGGGTTGLNGGTYQESSTVYGTGRGGSQSSGGSFQAGSGVASAYKVAGSFGQGANSITAGGGGGFYGGGVAVTSAGGGSSYIGNGIDGKTIAGNASMPNKMGSGNTTGNSGNGYAKITYLGPDNTVKDSSGNIVTYHDGSAMEIGDYFKIHYAANPNYVIDVYNAATSNGTKIQLYANSSSNRSSYGVLKTTSQNYYAIYFTLAHNMVIDVTNGSSALSTPLQLYTLSYSNAQQWMFIKDGNNYRIQSKLGTCIDLKQATVANGQVIQTYACTVGHTPQLWYFAKV